MFSLRKRVFAGKGNLQAEPFCPFLSNESGYLSLRRSTWNAFTRPGQPQHARTLVRGGKRS